MEIGKLLLLAVIFIPMFYFGGKNVFNNGKGGSGNSSSSGSSGNSSSAE